MLPDDNEFDNVIGDSDWKFNFDDEKDVEYARRWVGNELIDRYDSNFIKAWDELTENKHDITTDTNTDSGDISDDNPNKTYKE